MSVFAGADSVKNTGIGFAGRIDVTASAAEGVAAFNGIGAHNSSKAGWGVLDAEAAFKTPTGKPIGTLTFGAPMRSGASPHKQSCSQAKSWGPFSVEKASILLSLTSGGQK